MMKGLIGQCLNQETALKRVRARADLTEGELNQLKAWKVNMDKKFDHSKKVNKELEQEIETMRKVLADQDKQIQDLKDQLRRAKEEAICEYHDSNALLSKLGGSFMEGFDDALHQVQKAYPDLDVSNIKIDNQGQTFVMPTKSI